MVAQLGGVLRLLELFTGVALRDPISFVLMVAGAAITGAAVLLAVYLLGGAMLALFTPG